MQNNGRRRNKCNIDNCLQAYDITLSLSVRTSSEDSVRRFLRSDSHTSESRTRAYTEGQHQ